MEQHRYNGPEYVPQRDNPRLDSQLERVKALMLDHQWRTLEAIAEATKDPAASISAQLRHLRKKRFGSYRVERRHVGGGLYEYQVLDPLVTREPLSPCSSLSMEAHGMGSVSLSPTSPYNVVE